MFRERGLSRFSFPTLVMAPILLATSLSHGTSLSAPVRSGCRPHDARMERLLAEGRRDYRLGQYAIALGEFERGLAAARQASDGAYAAQFLTGIGAVQDTTEEYAAALRSDRAALAIYQSIGCRSDEAKQLVNLANVDEARGELHDAVQEYLAGLGLYERLRNVDGEAKARNSLAAVENDLGEYAKALFDARTSLALARLADDDETQAKALDNIGDAEQQIGEYSDAEASYLNALGAYDRLAQQPNIGIAKALIGAGRVDEVSGRYEDALGAQNKALDIARKLGDRDQIAIALENLADTEQDLGELANARAQHRLALQAFASIGDELGVEREHTNLGNVEMQQGDPYAALGSYEAALGIDRRLGARDGEGGDLANLGEAEAQLQWYDEALASQRSALALHQRVGNRAGEARDLDNLGNIEQAVRRYDAAAAHARKAAALDASLGLPMWKALRTLAAAEASLDRVDLALRYYEAAIDDIERLRAEIAMTNGPLTGTRRATFFATTLLVYDQYIDYLSELNVRFPGKGYDRKALEIFERRQGRAFLEEIAGTAAQRFSGVPAEIPDRERQFTLQTALLIELVAKARSREHPDAPAIASLERLLLRVRAEQQALETQIAIRFPDYYRLRHPQPLRVACAQAGCTTFAEFQRAVLRNGEAVAVYDVLANRSILWLVTKQQLALFQLGGGAAAATKLIEAFAPSACAAPEGRSVGTAVKQDLPRRALTEIATEALPACEEAASALYEWLLPPPAEALLANARTLFVVPSGPLYGVPFEALVTRMQSGAAHYLIEDRAVAYLSSASLLNVLRSRASSSVASPDPLLAFANPSYTEPQSASVSFASALGLARSNALQPYAGGTYAPLPGSEDEARASFAALGVSEPPNVPPQDAFYTADRASLASVEALNASGRLQSYRYVLFGTHAILTDTVRAIAQPSLVLAHPVSSDGFLTMADVFALSFRAQAVILSACDSAGGTVASGEGVQGLTQAFMYAGTPVVGVTDWEVLDTVAQQLTPAFFASMAHGESAAQALRQAKLALLHGKDPLEAHPFAWAPMVIFGDGDD